MTADMKMTQSPEYGVKDTGQQAADNIAMETNVRYGVGRARAGTETHEISLISKIINKYFIAAKVAR